VMSAAVAPKLAAALVVWTQTRGMLDPQKVIAYGRSLGGGAAAILAASRPSPALRRLLMTSGSGSSSCSIRGVGAEGPATHLGRR
jgi:dienelactone hydrolase